MANDNVEITIRPDGVYQVVMAFPAEKFKELIKDGYGYRENLSSWVTQLLADRYVKENYAELSKLIDLETVKLLATRKLANVVAKGD